MPETTSLRDAPNYYISEHILLADLICPCCDTVKVIPALYRHVSLLERLRRELGLGIVITSGYRCPRHNAAVGGAARSWHLLFATDVTLDPFDRETLEELARLAEAAGFGGIGRYERHLHLDLRPETARWRG